MMRDNYKIILVGNLAFVKVTKLGILSLKTSKLSGYWWLPCGTMYGGFPISIIFSGGCNQKNFMIFLSKHCKGYMRMMNETNKKNKKIKKSPNTVWPAIYVPMEL